jgi:outer membrane receptor protein involved in Fe transport
MSRSTRLQQFVRFTLASAAIAVASPAYSADPLPEVVVTAQKRSESIQDVPIAVSAFSQDELTSRGVDGGPQILQAIPNVTFSKQNFTSYNLQIRGVGSKLIAASGDQGVGIHLNNAPLAASRFFEAEFFDMERIEVLRGPQGTLYGRNATGGVFNAITAKPSKEFESSVTLDVGNYDSVKVKGMVNLPMGDMFQLRLAGTMLNRDGYLHNTANDSQIDGRELFSTRVTLAFQPTESLRGFLMWEHFEEDDDRQRTGAQLCTKDTGPASVGGVPTTNALPDLQPLWFLSQGCLPGSLYSDGAYGTLNSNGALGGVFSNLLGLYPGDVYANQRISRDLRTTNSYYLPNYSAESDIIELNLELSVTDALTFTSLTSFNDDSVTSRQDYNRAIPNGVFPVFLNDPQIGNTNRLSVYDKSFIESETLTQELRLQSSFDGPVNFNVGGIYINQKSPDQGYYVFFNTGTAYAECFNAGPCNTNPLDGSPWVLGDPLYQAQIYIDPNMEPNGEGHNYYLNKQTFSLRSLAGFGEVYLQIIDDLKATLGLRYTKDKKNATSYDFNQQFIYPGRGFGPDAIDYQKAEFTETTGRIGFDWKVAEDVLLYAFYSKGYKGGGFNSATAGNVETTYAPEFVNAIELGVKSAFADGLVQANATVFSYDYEGYQISRIVNLTSVNDNIDADIYGAEFEVVFQPFDGTRLDANIGLLRTEIQGNEVGIDVMNRTQGDPNFTVIKGFSGTNCVAPTAAVAAVLGAINAGLAPTTTLPSICPSSNFPAGRFSTLGGPNYLGFVIAPSEGTPVQLNGKELPNSPSFTINLGVQQSVDLSDTWSATARVDYYRQSDSYARIYNSEFDRLDGWSNINVSVGFDNADLDLSILAYVKNALDDDNITDAYLTDDSSGLYTNTFLTDPRLFGMSITKKF